MSINIVDKCVKTDFVFLVQIFLVAAKVIFWQVDSTEIFFLYDLNDLRLDHVQAQEQFSQFIG